MRLAENNLVQLFVSKEILREIKDVLFRPEVREPFPEITDETITAFVERLRKVSELIESVPRRFAFMRDVDDEPYINLAIEVQADYLVSRDHDLLDLMKWSTEEGREFQKRFRFLTILDPASFLRHIEQHLSESI